MIKGVAAVLVVLCVQAVVLDAQDTQDFAISVYGNHLWVFTTATGELTPVSTSNPFVRFNDPERSFSPSEHHLISWEGYPHLFEDGLLLTSLDEPELETNLPLDASIEPHFAETQWPLGERFALVRAGIVTGGDPEYPNTIWMLDTNAWLVDNVQQTINRWSWNCDTLIIVENARSGQDDSREFAIQCTADLPPFAFETNFLTVNGVRMALDGQPHPLYTRTQRYEPGWVFTLAMDQVAVVNRHTDAPWRDEVLIYALDGSARWLATFDRLTQLVLNLFWSPTGRYLAISTACTNLTIADCLQIRDMQTDEVIWDAGRLGQTISRTRYFEASSIYWLNDSDFLILGHFVNDDEGSYIWHLSLDQSQPLARWEIPSSLRYIINVNS